MSRTISSIPTTNSYRKNRHDWHDIAIRNGYWNLPNYFVVREAR